MEQLKGNDSLESNEDGSNETLLTYSDDSSYQDTYTTDNSSQDSDWVRLSLHSHIQMGIIG